jgi:hypothetical protein
MEKGYLIVQTSIAKGSLPLEGARVLVYNAGEKESLFDVATGLEGKTEKITLSAPDKQESETPNNGQIPFGAYDIYVEKDRFYSVFVQNAQIFAEQTSIQYVNMIPLPEGVSEGENTIIVVPQNL